MIPNVTMLYFGMCPKLEDDTGNNCFGKRI